MPANETYRAFLTFFFPTFLSVCLVSQAAKVFMIKKYTPKYMSAIQKVMYCNSIFQTVHVIVCWLMQFRQISNVTPVQIWSYGYGRYFPPWIGYCFYHVSQAMTFGNGTMVLVTLFLKTEAAMVAFFKNCTRFLIIFAITIPMILSLTMEILLVVTRAYPEEMQEHYRLLNLNNTEYTVVGVVDVLIWPSAANLCIMVTTVFALPCFGIASYRAVKQHIIRTSDRVSSAKNAQNKLFIKGLVIQTFLPLICYCPISTVYLLVAFVTHEEFLFQQYFMFTFPAFPALIDPFLTIYFTKPYRDAIRKRFNDKKVSSIFLTVKPHSAANTNSHPM